MIAAIEVRLRNTRFGEIDILAGLERCNPKGYTMSLSEQIGTGGRQRIGFGRSTEDGTHVTS